MKILVCGASGFIGRHITVALQAAGHTVIRGVRKPSQPNDIMIDYCKDTTKDAWLPKLTDIDVVVNTIGVLRNSKNQSMKVLHEQTPSALFSACQNSDVKRIVQISALGVDQGVETQYFQTKLAAESVLKNLTSSALRYLILRPSVVYGDDGVSAKMFRFQAELPLHVLPTGGHQAMQPVHIDDICAAIAHWLADNNARSQTVAAVGAGITDMRGMLDSYRQQLGHSTAAWHLSIPDFFVKVAAFMGDAIPASPLCNDTLTMLNAGSTADNADFSQLLGRSPKSYQQFIAIKNSD